MFFFLAQTEQGDIFKITLDTDEDMVSPEWFKYWKNIMMICLKHMFCLHKSEDMHAMFTHTHKNTCFAYTEVRIHMLCLHKNEYKHAIG